MQLKLFGSPALWRNGEQVGGVVAQRRRLALLCALAILAPPGRPAVSRERLLALLWPSDDSERSRAALSQALYAIRRELGDDLITGSAELRLDPDRLSCDYWDFRRALTERADSTVAEMRIGALLDGMDLAEVAGFEFWAEAERASADREWQVATERAARSAEAADDHGKAIRWRRALANLDPLSARTAIALASALVESGEREAALRQLRVHATLVRQDLEAEPDAKVLAMISELQQASVAPDAPPPVGIVCEPEPATPDAYADSVAPTSHGTVTDPSTGASGSAAIEAVAQDLMATADRLRPESRVARAPRRFRIIGLAATVAVIAAVAVALGTRTPAVSRAPAAVTDAPVYAMGDIAGDSLGPTVAAMVGTNLARAPGVEVIGAARMAELRSLDGGTALRAAREAGATELLDGTLTRMSNGQYQLLVSRSAVATGRVLSSARAQGDDLFSLVDRITADLLATSRTMMPTDGLAAVTTPSIDAWRLFEAGRRELAAGHRAPATTFFRAALARDSSFALAALGLADALTSTSREYLPVMQQALRTSARTPGPVAMWIRVQWLSAMNDPGMGALLDTLARQLPRDLDVQMMRAAPALYERADFAEGTRALLTVWEADSAALRDPARRRCYACEATVHLTTVLTHADSLASAEAIIRRSLARRPATGQFWSLLASVLERDPDRLPDLRAAVDSAVTHGEPGARGALLLSATRRGDTTEFNSLLATLAASDPNRQLTEAWARAILYRNLERYDEALLWAKRYASTPNPGAAEERRIARTLEAAVLLDMGRAREAASIWQQMATLPRPEWTASRVARQEVFYRTLAATARFTAGDTAGLFATADSLAVLGVISGYARDRVLHHHVRGLAWLAANQLDDAITEFRQAIVYPSMGFTRTNVLLARALETRGHASDAARWYAAAAQATRDGSPLYQNPLAAARAARRVLGR